MDRRLVVDVPDERDIEQLKHDFAMHAEVFTELAQRVRTLEALRRQEPARGGSIRHRSWWGNGNKSRDW
jgi:hypothetical protein